MQAPAKWRPRHVWVLLTVFAAGCGGAGVKHPTFPVKGTVTYKGQPVPRGTIRFNPADMELPTARGTIGPDGSFVLETYAEGDGAVAGEHVVTVEAWTEEVPEFLDEEGTQPNPNYTEPQPIVPRDYFNADDSPLRLTVDEKENDFQVALEGEIKDEEEDDDDEDE